MYPVPSSQAYLCISHKPLNLDSKVWTISAATHSPNLITSHVSLTQSTSETISGPANHHHWRTGHVCQLAYSCWTHCHLVAGSECHRSLCYEDDFLCPENNTKIK